MRAIDFGTSSTAAAQRNGGEPELVTFGGAYAFPSSVAIHEGDLVCGEEADNLLPGDPTAGTRAPKLMLAGDGMAYLGGRLVGVEEIIPAILAEADGGDQPAPEGARALTHPAGWEPEGPRCQALRAGAQAAGLGEVMLVSEPEAVAWHAARHLPTGQALLVFDLGGGTCDMAALARAGAGFELLARPRSEEIGGELADALLLELLLERLGHGDPAAAQALRDAQTQRLAGYAERLDPELVAWLSCLVGTERQIRSAKARLSRHERAPVRLPAPPRGSVELTRDELAAAMRPHLQRAATALGEVAAEAGLEPAAVPVLLSGAASVMPVVAQVLHDTLATNPTPVVPAKGAVALGALRALEATQDKGGVAVATATPGGIERAGHRGLAGLRALMAEAAMTPNDRRFLETLAKVEDDTEILLVHRNGSAGHLWYCLTDRGLYYTARADNDERAGREGSWIPFWDVVGAHVVGPLTHEERRDLGVRYLDLPHLPIGVWIHPRPGALTTGGADRAEAIELARFIVQEVTRRGRTAERPYPPLWRRLLGR
ncbi:MAG: Hsp70 family protein [Dehalococcoidia bacterium]